jgi:hypothetical protein
MSVPVAVLRERWAAEFRSQMARLFDREITNTGGRFLTEIRRSVAMDKVQGLFLDLKTEEFQVNRVKELLYGALGDSHNYRDKVMRALSLLETGNEQ